MQDRLVCVLCNTKPRTLAGFTSNGVVLCATPSAKGEIGMEILAAPEGSQAGDEVFFEGHERNPPEKMGGRKTAWDKTAPGMVIDKDGLAKWGEVAMKTEKGPITATAMKNGLI